MYWSLPSVRVRDSLTKALVDATFKRAATSSVALPKSSIEKVLPVMIPSISSDILLNIIDVLVPSITVAE